jgi:uncharacterized membrane protein YkoI
MKYYQVMTNIIAICLLAFTANLWAEPHNSSQSSSQSGSDKAMAAEIAKRKYSGKVLKVDEVKKNGATLYLVRLILDDGRVKILTVDIEKGKII